MRHAFVLLLLVFAGCAHTVQRPPTVPRILAVPPIARIVLRETPTCPAPAPSIDDSMGASAIIDRLLEAAYAAASCPDATLAPGAYLVVAARVAAATRTCERAREMAALLSQLTYVTQDWDPPSHVLDFRTALRELVVGCASRRVVPNMPPQTLPPTATQIVYY